MKLLFTRITEFHLVDFWHSLIDLSSWLQVEAALMSSNYVDNIMLYADPFHSYCVALVVPSHSELQKWAQESGIQYTSFSELCDKPEAIKEVQASLSKVSSSRNYLP